MDEPIDVDREDDLVAQAVNASAQRKDQAKDAAAWEHNIALCKDLMMRLIIIQSAGGKKEEEVKKISLDLHLLEKRLKNKTRISVYARWIDGCHSSARCVPMNFIQNNVALTNKYDDDSGEKGERRRSRCALDP